MPEDTISRCNENVRIISARKATQRERKHDEEKN